MPKCVVMGHGGKAVKIDSALLGRLQRQAKIAYLKEHYNKTFDFCSVCGIPIKTEWGEPLGRYFVMDKKGQFYCMHCDHIFDDIDERIYVPEEDEDDE